MNTRIIFDIKNYEKVYDIITELGGEPCDFVTDDCVELGNDQDYIKSVTEALKEAGIKFDLARMIM